MENKKIESHMCKSKKIFTTVGLGLMLALLVAPNISSAEVPSMDMTGLDLSDAQLIAEVNFNEGKILSQKANDFDIEFVLSNGKLVQPGIRYGVKLTKISNQEKGSDEIVSQKMYDEVISLGENDQIKKNINYQAPGFLSGEYNITLVAYSKDGMMLGLWPIDNPVELKGSGNYIGLSDCYVSVENSQKDGEFDLLSGVDIAPGEQLFLNCDVENHMDMSANFSVRYESFERSFNANNKVKTEIKEGFQLKDGDKTLKLPINYLENPQAYDVKITLVKDDADVSNSVIAHYVISGESATIQNIRLDKGSYKAGEQAKLSVMLSGSASNFPGSRLGNGVGGLNGILSVVIKDEEGTVCSEKDVAISNLDYSLGQDINLDVKKDCVSPSIYLQLKDARGKVLYATDMKISPTNDMASNGGMPSGSNNGSWISKILYAVTILATLLSLILIIFAMIKKRSRRGMMTFLMFVIFGTYLLVSPSPASANTYLLFSDHLQVVVNWPSSRTYSIGENAIVSAGIPSIMTCGNLVFKDVQVKCGINNTDTVVSEATCDADCRVHNALCKVCSPKTLTSKTFAVNDCGDHNLICAVAVWGHGTSSHGVPGADQWYYAGIPDYTNMGSVICGSCGSANGGSFTALPTTGLCSEGSVNNQTSADWGWSWACNGTGGGTQAWCIAYKVAAQLNGICGTAQGGNYVTAPTVGLCSSGTAMDLKDAGGWWSWWCSGSGGGASNSCGANKVAAQPAPTLNITASPSTLPYGGGSSIISWTVSNAASCTAYDDWSGSKDPNGGSGSQNMTSTKTYSMECWNSDNVSSGRKSVTVTVAPPCSPVTDCAPNTCIGSTCQDCKASGYWVTANGTKDCRDNNWKEVSPN
jgi:hypothetical protein